MYESIKSNPFSTTAKIPWRLTSSLDEIDSLFKHESLPYNLNAYSCHCEDAEIKTVMYHEAIEDEIAFECPTCANKDFYHANQFLGNSAWYKAIYELFSSDILENLVPEIVLEDSTQTLMLRITMEIPERYDAARNKFGYCDKILYEVIIPRGEKLQEHTYANFGSDEFFDSIEYILSNDFVPGSFTHIKTNKYLIEYRQAFLHHIQCNEHFKHIETLQRCNTLYKAAIFIAYPHLSDFEFVYWKNIDLLPNKQSISIVDALDFVMDYRTQKSFKNMVYQGYERSMRHGKDYNFCFVYLVARHIRDVNFACKMVEIDMNDLLKEVEFSALERYFAFLMGRYTPKQLVKLFCDYAKEEIFWFEDTLRSFENRDSDFSDLPKIPCDVIDIHDAVYHYIHAEEEMAVLSATTFSYEDSFHEACGTFNEHVVTLPENGMQLYDWGNQLHNCLSFYCDRIVTRNTTVFGIFKNQTLHMAIEIQDNKIIQANKKYNEKLNEEETNVVMNWYRATFEVRKTT